MDNELIVKIALLFIGATLSFISVLLIWGFQKLISTLLQHSDELLKIGHRLGAIEKDVAPFDKMKTDLNNYYQRLKTVEGNLEIQGD